VILHPPPPTLITAAAGQNVTIPSDWRIILDESPPPLSVLLIEGWLRFDNASDATLTAAYVIVRGANGILQIGAPDAPHPTKATISLTGTRQQPDFVVNTGLNFGSKVLGAYAGGAIRIFGQPVGKRWASGGSGGCGCARVAYLAGPARAGSWRQSHLPSCCAGGRGCQRTHWPAAARRWWAMEAPAGPQASRCCSCPAPSTPGRCAGCLGSNQGGPSPDIICWRKPRRQLPAVLPCLSTAAPPR
jgi:hypothetical protein